MLSGMTSEQAVRQRLRRAVELRSDAPEAVIHRLLSFGWSYEMPIRLLDATEELFLADPPWSFVDSVQRGKGAVIPVIAQLLIMQKVAGHLGLWAVRGPQLRDARIARSLYRATSVRDSIVWTDLIQSAELLARKGRSAEAVRVLLSADRLHRTPAVLLLATRLLYEMGDHHRALWTARAALLESPAAFGSEERFDKIRGFAARLGARLEGTDPIEPPRRRWGAEPKPLDLAGQPRSKSGFVLVDDQWIEDVSFVVEPIPISDPEPPARSASIPTRVSSDPADELEADTDLLEGLDELIESDGAHEVDDEPTREDQTRPEIRRARPRRTSVRYDAGGTERIAILPVGT